MPKSTKKSAKNNDNKINTGSALHPPAPPPPLKLFIGITPISKHSNKKTRTLKPIDILTFKPELLLDPKKIKNTSTEKLLKACQCLLLSNLDLTLVAMEAINHQLQTVKFSDQEKTEMEIIVGQAKNRLLEKKEMKKTEEIAEKTTSVTETKETTEKKEMKKTEEIAKKTVSSTSVRITTETMETTTEITTKTKITTTTKTTVTQTPGTFFSTTSQDTNRNIVKNNAFENETYWKKAYWTAVENPIFQAVIQCIPIKTTDKESHLEGIPFTVRKVSVQKVDADLVTKIFEKFHDGLVRFKTESDNSQTLHIKDVVSYCELLEAWEENLKSYSLKN